MKVILFPFDSIMSKTGTAYVKANGLTERGTMVEVFLSKKDFDAFGLDIKKVSSMEDVKNLFDTLETVNVEYNEKGRIVGLN